MTANPILSKSKYLSGRQCAKLLWTHYNAKDRIPEADAATQAIFDQGHEVGALAKKLYPDGIEIEGDPRDLAQTLVRTRELVALRKPLFEAAFSATGGYCRVDVLNPVGRDEWDVIEVKSTADVKEVHREDLAFQAWVLTEAGMKVRRCHLCHVNTEFVRQGEIDPHQFFTLKDETAQVKALTPKVEGQVAAMLDIIRQGRCPDVRIGKHCSEPYECPLTEQCWGFLPQASVFTLYRGGDKGHQLLSQGIQHLAEIPDNFPLSDNQQIQRTALQTGQPYVDKPALQSFLANLAHPVTYFDFETVGPAIPLYDGTRPFRQVPFQYSVHVVRQPGADPEHYEFLAEGRTDPRPAFMAQLKRDVPETGSVVAYNAAFELNCLAGCCEALPQYEPWVKRVGSRVVDLLQPFRGFRYYHPQQNGTASIKAVLPALTGISYEDLNIKEGGTASQEFLRITFTDVPPGERRRIRRDLLDYCALDTRAMIEIVNRLQQLAR
jgi:Domain of unknown function(DUF2779)/Domain of unknown function DUF83